MQEDISAYEVNIVIYSTILPLILSSLIFLLVINISDCAKHQARCGHAGVGGIGPDDLEFLTYKTLLMQKKKVTEVINKTEIVTEANKMMEKTAEAEEYIKMKKVCGNLVEIMKVSKQLIKKVSSELFREADEVRESVLFVMELGLM